MIQLIGLKSSNKQIIRVCVSNQAKCHFAISHFACVCVKSKQTIQRCAKMKHSFLKTTNPARVLPSTQQTTTKKRPKIKSAPADRATFPRAIFPAQRSRPALQLWKARANRSRVWKRIDCQIPDSKHTKKIATNAINQQGTTNNSTKCHLESATGTKEEKRASGGLKLIPAGKPFQHQDSPRSTVSGGARRLGTRSQSKSKRVGGGWCGVALERWRSLAGFGGQDCGPILESRFRCVVLLYWYFCVRTFKIINS